MKSIIKLLPVILLAVIEISAQNKINLSVNEAVDLAVKNSRTLTVANAKIKGAEAKLGEADAAKYPSLKLGASYTRLSAIDPFSIATPFGSFQLTSSILDNYNARVTLSQPLFTGFRLENSSKLAALSVKGAEEDKYKDQSELIYNVKTAYWNHFKARLFKKLLDENIVQMQAILKDAKNMLSQGLLTKNDVLKIEVQLSDLQFRQIEAENNVHLSMLFLNNLLNLPLTTEISLSSSADEKKESYDNLQSVLLNAFAKRPEILSADTRMKLSETGIDVAKGGWYPTLALQANYTYAKPNQRVFPQKNEFKGTWDISLALSFDIWNWNTTGYQTEQAQAQYIQASEAKELIKEGVTLEVTQSHLLLKQAASKIDIVKLNVEQAEENFRVTGEKFKNGLALSTDVISAETALLQAKTNYTNALVDYTLALVKLQKSIGE